MVTDARRKERDTCVRFEVHRVTTGRHRATADHKPAEFIGLDRARLAAFAYALDGPVPNQGITGVVRIVRVFYVGDRAINREVVDVIDERVACRVLNEVRLPSADSLTFSLDDLQDDIDALAEF